MKKRIRVVRQPSGFEQLPLKKAISQPSNRRFAGEKLQGLEKQPTGLSLKSSYPAAERAVYNAPKKRNVSAVFLLPVILFAAAFPLAAQDGTNGGAPAPARPLDNAETVYVIRGVDFDIEGRTRPFALIHTAKLAEGERVRGKANLEKYISGKQQELLNQRVLEEAAIEYTFGSPEEDGAVPVNLLVRVKDTWNFIIIPYPKYDSNEGLSFTIKARDYNFLGTMNPLNIDLGYLYSTKDGETKNVFNFILDSDTPFYAGGLNWNFNFDHILEYTIGDPLHYENVTGVSVELPAGFTSVTLGIDQYFVVNEENSQADRDKYGLGERMDGAYGATELYSEWKIPLGVTVASFGELSYTPRLAGKVAYRPGGVDEPQRPRVELSQTFGFGRVNWIGNYREGLEASLGNTNNFYLAPNDYGINISAAAAGYKRFTKLFGISSRFQYRHWFNETYYDAGDILRGIPDAKLRAENMLSLNLDLPFRLLRFAPSEWLLNRAVRIFDFEMHLSPFIDIAFMKGLQSKSGSAFNGETRDFTSPLAGGGFELIIFPNFFRSLYLRASVGYNIGEIIETGNLPKWDEIFIGIGHHY